MWLRACAFDIVLPRKTYNHMQKREDDKEYFGEIDLDKELAIGGL